MILLWLPPALGATLSVGLDGSGDFASLQEAVAAAADGDRIEIGPGAWSEPLVLEGRTLTLAGAGADQTVLDGGDDRASPVIRVVGGAITLEDLAISDHFLGLSAEGASLTLSGARLTGLGGRERGGAISAVDTDISVSASELTDNLAPEGGAIRLEGGSLQIADSRLDGNAAGSGGAIWAGDGVPLAITGGGFAGNYAWDGGAIRVGAGGSLDLEEVEFIENAAKRRGGAVELGPGATLVGMLTDWRMNASKRGGAISAGEGGAIQLRWSVFEENRALGHGGAIYALYDTALNIEHAVFEENSSDYGYGGAIQTFGPITGYNNYFGVNFAYIWGGAIAIYGASLRDEGSRFQDNTAVNGDGGAIYAELASRLRLDRTQIVQNNAGGAGGGVSARLIDEVLIEGALFDDNLGNRGGGLFLSTADATLSRTPFIDNVAGGEGGGVLAVAGSRLTMRRCDFTNHSSGGNGGSIALNDETSGFISEARFDYSASDLSGGVIALNAGDFTKGELELTDIDIIDGRADGHGGAIHAQNTLELRLERVRIIGSRAGAEGFGGAMYIEELSSVSVQNSRFTDNQAGFGGAVYSYRMLSDDNEWKNDVFDMNRAYIAGAAAFVDGGGVSFLNNTLLANGADREAGGIALASTPIDFRNNLLAATEGGAAFQVYDPIGEENFAWNDWYGNLAGDVAGDWSSPPGYQNQDKDPRLVRFLPDGDPDNDQLQLAFGSPLIDGGDPYVFDPDGSRSDIGAFGGPDLWAEDGDGDGQTSATDCDDRDPSIFRGAEEVDYDGVDQDCDGGEDLDLDDDGVIAAEAGGDDCYDQNPFLRACEEEEEKGCSAAPAAPSGIALAAQALIAGALVARRRRTG